MKFDIPHITILELIESSNLFKSRSDIRRNTKQNGIKLNGELVDESELDEFISVGDFINLFMDGRGKQLSTSFGTTQLILIERGKKVKALLRADKNGIEILN